MKQIPLILKPDFLDLDLLITNEIVSSKIYNKYDDFNFEMVNFPFIDKDVHRPSYYGVYILRRNRFASVYSNFSAFNKRNQFMTAKLLKLILIAKLLQ